MTLDTSPPLQGPEETLTQTFILEYPNDAARSIQALPLEEAAAVIDQQNAFVIAKVFERLSFPFSDTLLEALPEPKVVELLSALDIRTVTSLISRMSAERREHLLSLLNNSFATELRSLLEYPQDTAGRLMQTKVFAFEESTTAEQAITALRGQKNMGEFHQVYLTDGDRHLLAQVPIQQLALADGRETLSSLSQPIKHTVQAFDTRDDIVEVIEKRRISHIPVVDINQQLLGAIEGAALIDALRDDLSSDLQTMVGVSADERALSSSVFSVRKRQPWLQINLLTAFLAAGVVALFEDTISRFTALAILLPIAAGQSGNAGAQALAVTMRGLTLKEISMSHWLRVLMKECGAGLMNGIGIAMTCSAGIYVWSQSFGLALVMALAMIISMTIAGMAGALVPILLKRFGLDPAQSSSIVLTTITDIAGFMSFLGIATALSSMLA